LPASALSPRSLSPKLSGPVLPSGAGCGTIAFRKSNRPEGPDLDDCKGDNALVDTAGVQTIALTDCDRPVTYANGSTSSAMPPAQ